MTKDLFGDEVDLRDAVERELAEFDADTFAARLSRLRYWYQVYPAGYGMMSSEEYYLLRNGIIASNRGPGLDQLVKKARTSGLLHPYLADKVDSLRRIRNPFVHLRPMLDPDGLDYRAFTGGRSLTELLKKTHAKRLRSCTRLSCGSDLPGRCEEWMTFDAQTNPLPQALRPTSTNA